MRKLLPGMICLKTQKHGLPCLKVEKQGIGGKKFQRTPGPNVFQCPRICLFGEFQGRYFQRKTVIAALPIENTDPAMPLLHICKLLPDI